MPSLDQIQAQIPSKLAKSRKREVAELPGILWEDESLEDAVEGWYENGTGLLVRTNRRLVFLDKSLLGSLKVEDFPFDKISSIQYSTGMLLGKITITASGNRAQIDNVDKTKVQDFCEAVRARISATATSPPPAPQPGPTATPPTSDPIGDLERLGKLRDAGVLTNAEFETQKARILSSM